MTYHGSDALTVSLRPRHFVKNELSFQNKLLSNVVILLMATFPGLKAKNMFYQIPTMLSVQLFFLN